MLDVATQVALTQLDFQGKNAYKIFRFTDTYKYLQHFM